MPGSWHKQRTIGTAIEKVIDEHCDYVYLGRGLKNDSGANVIVLLDKPWLAESQSGVQCALLRCACGMASAYDVAR